MNDMIFVNLPVKDLERAKAFFARLGYTFNPQFTNELAACMVVSPSIFVMLLTEPFFSSFIDGPIADPASTEVLVALSASSREQVDHLVDQAVAAGGREYRDPTVMESMYQRSFADLDGHRWEIAWMDPGFVEGIQG